MAQYSTRQFHSLSTHSSLGANVTRKIKATLDAKGDPKLAEVLEWKEVANLTHGGSVNGSGVNGSGVNGSSDGDRDDGPEKAFTTGGAWVIKGNSNRREEKEATDAAADAAAAVDAAAAGRVLDEVAGAADTAIAIAKGPRSHMESKSSDESSSSDENSVIRRTPSPNPRSQQTAQTWTEKQIPTASQPNARNEFSSNEMSQARDPRFFRSRMASTSSPSLLEDFIGGTKFQSSSHKQNLTTTTTTTTSTTTNFQTDPFDDFPRFNRAPFTSSFGNLQSGILEHDFNDPFGRRLERRVFSSAGDMRSAREHVIRKEIHSTRFGLETK